MENKPKKKLPAGLAKAAKDIDKRVKKESSKDNSKIAKRRSIYYYASILNKNKINKK